MMSLQHAIDRVQMVVTSSHLPGWKENREAWGVIKNHLVQPNPAGATREPGYKFGDATPFKDRTGAVIHVGDILSFDKKEWGGQMEFEFGWNAEQGEWQHVGTLSDMGEWCVVLCSYDKRAEYTEH